MCLRWGQRSCSSLAEPAPNLWRSMIHLEFYMSASALGTQQTANQGCLQKPTPAFLGRTVSPRAAASTDRQPASAVWGLATAHSCLQTANPVVVCCSLN